MKKFEIMEKLYLSKTMLKMAGGKGCMRHIPPWIRHQGRVEKFRAEGHKFRLGPLVSGASKSSDEQKKRS